MGDFIKTVPSDLYIFNFEQGRNVTQDDLTELAGLPEGQYEEIDEPDGSGVAINIRQPIGQEVDPEVEDCALRCVAEVLGFKDILTAAGVASTPFPKSWAGQRSFRGATPFTNLPSIIASKNSTLRNARIGINVPTPITTTRAPFIAMRGTANVVRIFSRWIPGVGWGLLAYDTVKFFQCYNRCSEANDLTSLVKPHVPVGQVSSARLPGQFGTIPRGYETNALDVISERSARGGDV